MKIFNDGNYLYLFRYFDRLICHFKMITFTVEMKHGQVRWLNLSSGLGFQKGAAMPWTTLVVAMALMATATFVKAETQAWRDRVVAAVRPGAVVARRGLDNDPITQAVLFGQGGGKWSHVGIAVQLIPDGPIYIESAMPGAGTRLEKPEVFFSSEQASEGEVLLMPMNKVDAVQSAAKSLLGRPFDDQLVLDDDGKKLYCTELVAMALRRAGVIKDLPMRSVPSLPQKVIAPDDIVAVARAIGL
ncbi:MAG: hypothetical protein M0P52_08050 [Rhodoferax sp.]|nr:hypothetical protein [Rhodoferax sp.]